MKILIQKFNRQKIRKKHASRIVLIGAILLLILLIIVQNQRYKSIMRPDTAVSVCQNASHCGLPIAYAARSDCARASQCIEGTCQVFCPNNPSLPAALYEYQAKQSVKARYPELAQFPDEGISDTLPPLTIQAIQKGNERYLGFVTLGSGRPIIKVQCFRVTSLGNVSGIATYQGNVSTDTTMEFDPELCEYISQD